MTGRNQAPEHSLDTQPKGFDEYELVLGDILRGERATLGKSLLDVQRDIKIKASYVAAIENCDLSAFETPGFIAGYVRSYGRYLGLEPDLVYQAFCEESGFSHVEGLDAQVYAKRPSQRRPSPAARRAAANSDAVLARNPIYAAPRQNVMAEIKPGAVTSILTLGLLLIGLGYGGWSVLQEIQRVTVAPLDGPTQVLDDGPEIAGVVDVAPSSEQAELPTAPSAEALDRLYRPKALDAPVLVARDGPIANIDPASQGVYAALALPQAASAAAQYSSPAAPLSVLATAGLPLPPAEPLPNGQVPEVQVVAEAPPEVVMFARRPVWVRVRSADGTVLLEKILEEGERYVLPQTERAPVLRAGNSGSLFFAVNGETIGPAGPGASVAKNVSLAAADLTEKYGPANLDADPELKRLAALVIAPVEQQSGE
ncbi:MAG: helix-turn-helix domain-containing protein [Mangrovicoccus sp.]